MNISYNEDFKILTQSTDFYFKIEKAIFSSSIDGDNDIEVPLKAIYNKLAAQLLLYINPQDINWSGKFNNYSNFSVLYNNYKTDLPSEAFKFSSNSQELNFGNNTINISNINWTANFLQNNIELESIGNNYKSIYISSDNNYISKQSFLDYKNECRCYDDLDHQMTVYINSYGLKIY